LFLVIIYSVYRLWKTDQSNQPDSCEAYYSKVNLGDFGFLSDRPSGPPCYLGTCPQISKKADVVKAIQKYGIFDFCNTDAQDLNGGIRCKCFSNIMFNSDDTISQISFSMQTDSEVNQVLRKFDLPDSIGSDNYYVSSNGPPKFNLYFFYDRYRMSVGLMPQDGNTFDLSAQTKVVGVVYFNEAEYLNAKKLHKKVIWKGYGKYDLNGYQGP
jgi:hypothetical protein